MIITEAPIYKSKSVTKNGKRYDLDELSYVFDCPHCEYLLTTLDLFGAETTMDVHFFHHHPEKHVPLIDLESKEILERAFEDFRVRSFSAVGGIRPAAA